MNGKMQRVPHSVWGGKLDIYVTTSGSGPDVVYFPPTGLVASDPFVEALASRFTVHAVEFPGTSPEAPDAGTVLGTLWDLVLALEEVVLQLGLERPAAVGVSIGAMLAAELGANFPRLFASLILVGPLGLWREDEPLPNWQAEPSHLPGLLFADPLSSAASAAIDPQGKADEVIALRAGQIWALGCIGRYIWPIPEKGLAGRLHRVAVPTLVIRGDEDSIVPRLHAEDMTRAIQGARLMSIPSARHLPSVEHAQAVLALMSSGNP
ncbi:pimeloyl-ACP methyl ester carboxylesterase [Sphingobium xenophagum]|uniref:Pimeloyl-ACP methyl ester carboxylesterase n=1 Tax=Sphingobium xenophagum TaxID=121428 RepID=A0ABU1X5H4_SPHXE|nr:alpha/beta hydrolase [Sphingobium xenophagum]MDR7156829.1 pimeloyl-ACP methyl ester carboxylesterase [Sphingobium xenophagum]